MGHKRSKSWAPLCLTFWLENSPLPPIEFYKKWSSFYMAVAPNNSASKWWEKVKSQELCPTTYKQEIDPRGQFFVFRGSWVPLLYSPQSTELYKKLNYFFMTFMPNCLASKRWEKYGCQEFRSTPYKRNWPLVSMCNHINSRTTTFVSVPLYVYLSVCVFLFLCVTYRLTIF